MGDAVEAKGNFEALMKRVNPKEIWETGTNGTVPSR
jgi:hypothetical protein